MTAISLLFLGLIAIVIFPENDAQEQFQFSSFSQIPQTLLSQLSTSQIDNMKQQFAQQGGGSNAPSADETADTGDYDTQQGDGNNGETQQGDGGNGDNTFQFSSFSQIPQSLLSQLSSSQIENLKNQGKASNSPSGSSNASPGNSGNNPSGNPGNGNNSPNGSPGNGNGSPSGSPGNDQTFQFSSFSQIPQSLLDQLTSSQIENLKNQGQANFNPSGNPSDSQNSQPGSAGDYSVSEPEYSIASDSKNNPGSIPTFHLRPQEGGNGQSQQTFQYSSFSQIPQEVLDQLSSSQIENIKNILGKGQKPATNQPQTDNNPQTLEFSSFSQIPKNLIDGLSSLQINDMQRAYDPNDSLAKNVINTILNYVSVGGQLTGIPPIDLLLLRFYLNEGPKKFCGSVM